MVADIEILMPKYTKNLILNASLENNIAGWVAEQSTDGKIARFEGGKKTPNPDGFDFVFDPNDQMTIVGEAALAGEFGAKLAFDGSGDDSYGLLNLGGVLKHVNFGFLLDLNDFVMDAATQTNISNVILGAGGAGVVVWLQEAGGVINAQVIHATDAGATASPFFAIPQIGVSSWEIEWFTAANPGDNDGFIRVVIDGVTKYEDLNVDNDTQNAAEIQYGLNSYDVDNTGSIYMDNCFWYDTSEDFVSLDNTLERARFGRKSLEINTPGAINNEGGCFRVDTTNINGSVVGSAYVRGSGRVRIRLVDGFTGVENASQTIQIHDRYWQRIWIEGTTEGSDDYRVYIETDGTAPQAETFYVDGAQLEEGGALTSYCDGDQPGCRWNGVLHASTSERESTSMAGGEWVPIRDDECDPNSYYTEISGFGMPPITINRQQMALTAGAFYDSTRVNERVMIINTFFRDRGAQKRKGTAITYLYELRQRIEDLIKPDNNPQGEPFRLRFGQDGKWLYNTAYYESGMEFELDVRNKWTAASSIRFLALDPYFTEDSQETALLEFGYELGDDLFYAMRVDGEWTKQFNGVNNSVYAFEFDQNERPYLGGGFTQDDDGFDIRRFAYANDDFSALTQAASGIAGNILNYIEAIEAHPNGKIYLGGIFTQDGDGNAYGNVAEYDPATNTFDDLNNGVSFAPFDTEVFDISIAPSGNVYFVGAFDTAGGAAANRIAYWDGGAWHTVGDIVAEIGAVTIRAVLALADDSIYVSGGGVGTAVLFYWNGTVWSTLFSVSDLSGVSSRALLLSSDGSVLFGVNGTVSATEFIARLYRWNGATGEQLGENFAGPLPIMYELAEDDEGNIYVSVSDVTSVGSIISNGNLFIWNGSSFAFPDFEYTTPFASQITTVFLRGNDIYFGCSQAMSNMNVSSINYLNNVGTAQVFPIIAIEGPGKILWIENQTTKQIAFMNYTNQDNELLEIDFRTGKKTVTSNYRGSVPDAILPNSEDILLAAGSQDAAKANKFAVLIVDAVEPTVQLRYTPTHWSIDALDML